MLKTVKKWLGNNEEEDACENMSSMFDFEDSLDGGSFWGGDTDYLHWNAYTPERVRETAEWISTLYQLPSNKNSAPDASAASFIAYSKENADWQRSLARAKFVIDIASIVDSAWRPSSPNIEQAKGFVAIWDAVLLYRDPCPLAVEEVLEAMRVAETYNLMVNCMDNLSFDETSDDAAYREHLDNCVSSFAGALGLWRAASTQSFGTDHLTPVSRYGALTILLGKKDIDNLFTHPQVSALAHATGADILFEVADAGVPLTDIIA